MGIAKMFVSLPLLHCIDGTARYTPTVPRPPAMLVWLYVCGPSPAVVPILS